jgi:hypothetical protein
MVDPNLGSWTGNVVSGAFLDSTTYGSGTSLPATWDPQRLFYHTSENTLYRNTGTEGTPVWSTISGAELYEITTAETYNPEKQTGLIHLVFEKDGIVSGKVKFYIDGVLQDTYDTSSTGQYNKIIKPSTSLQFVSEPGTFATTQYNGNLKSPQVYLIADFHGFAISGDGFTVQRSGSRYIQQHPITTAFDLTSEQNTNKQSDGTNFTGSDSVHALRYDDVGDYLFAGTNKNTVERCTLDDTPWRFTGSTIGSTGQMQSFNVSSEVSGGIIYGLEFSTDGTKMYVSESDTSATIFQYTMTSAWDLSTCSYASKSYATGMNTSDFRAFAIEPNGEFLFTTKEDSGTSDTFLHRHTMSTPWDISTASATDSINISDLVSYTSVPLNGGMQVSADGSIIYISRKGGSSRTTYGLELSLSYNGSFKVAVN